MNNWIAPFGRSALSIAILCGGVVGFLLLRPPQVPKQKPATEPPPLVMTATAIEHTDGISFEVDGVVVPYRQIQLAAQVSGKVEYKSDNCRVGRTVKKGDLLLRIEPDDYQLEVRRLNDELSQADAMIKELDAEIRTEENQIASSQQQLEIDVRQLRRNQDLQSRGAASASEVDTARRAELATLTTLQSMIDEKNVLTQRRIRMEAAKSLVQANLEKAELSLRRTEIISPLDGVVVNESVEQDSFVQPGSTMVVLQETSRLDVSCKLHMKQMHWLWQGAGSSLERGGYEFPETPATVIYELGGEKYCWDAVIDRYEGAGVDQQTRMVPCRVHVDDPTVVMTLAEYKRDGSWDAAQASGEYTSDFNGTAGERDSDSGDIRSTPEQNLSTISNSDPPTLMTGMFVDVLIHATPPVPMVRLPQQSVQPGNLIWVVEKGRLKQKPITIAMSEDDYVIATQNQHGVQAGDQIVISPLARPTDGMAVSTDEAEYAKQLKAINASSGWPGGGGPR